MNGSIWGVFSSMEMVTDSLRVWTNTFQDRENIPEYAVECFDVDYRQRVKIIHYAKGRMPDGGS